MQQKNRKIRRNSVLKVSTLLEITAPCSCLLSKIAPGSRTPPVTFIHHVIMHEKKRLITLSCLHFLVIMLAFSHPPSPSKKRKEIIKNDIMCPPAPHPKKRSSRKILWPLNSRRKALWLAKSHHLSQKCTLPQGHKSTPIFHNSQVYENRRGSNSKKINNISYESC